MKKNNIYFGILLLGLVAIIVWASAAMLGPEKTVEMYNVSVIVNDSNNERFVAMRDGLEQAASDNHIILKYVSTGELTKEEQISLVYRELENGADGIIVQPVFEELDMDSLEGIGADVPIVLLESEIEPEGVYPVVKPDNSAIGETIAQAIKSDYGEALKNKKIGILCSNTEMLAMQQRLSGFNAVLEEMGIEVTWSLTNTENMGESLAQKIQSQPIDILVALEDSALEIAADYILAEQQRISLYGAGCSEENVYYLDKGVIDIMVVPNEFNMGYLSMEMLAYQLEYHIADGEGEMVDFLVVNKDNLYDADNQKILFPIVQ